MTTCCRHSGGWRIISWARASTTAPAAAGGSKRRGCPGPFSTRSAKPREQMGIRKIPDFNTGDNEGVGYFHVNQKRGRRWSSARGFLKPALQRPNLRLEKNVLVDRLIVENGRAVGVRFIQGGETVEARAKGEVILCAGSIGSVQVLHRSGIGPADWLAPLGIDTVLDRPGRRAQSAGPSAAARDLQGRRRAHAQRDLLLAGPARPDGPRLRVPPPRAADHGAVAARHLHPFRSASRTRQHPVPRAAAVARQVRRSPAPLPRDHRERLQSAADLARHRAHPLGRARPRRRRSRRIIWRPTKTARSPPTPSAPRGG